MKNAGMMWIGDDFRRRWWWIGPEETDRGNGGRGVVDVEEARRGVVEVTRGILDISVKDIERRKRSKRRS